MQMLEVVCFITLFTKYFRLLHFGNLNIGQKYTNFGQFGTKISDMIQSKLIETFKSPSVYL